MSRRLTAAERAYRRAGRIGWTLMLIVGSCTIGFCWMAAAIDRAHFVTLDQSLRSAGL